MKNPNPLEREIEKRVCAYAKALGILSYKFTSPSRAHVPDRIFFAPERNTFLIEFKRKGEKPTKAQAIEIEKIRATGTNVYVVDNVEEGKGIIDMEARY